MAASAVSEFSVFIWLSDAEEEALRCSALLCRADFLKIETQAHTHTDITVMTRSELSKH